MTEYISNFWNMLAHVVEPIISFAVLSSAIAFAFSLFGMMLKWKPFRRGVAEGFFVMIDEIQVKQKTERELMKSEIKTIDSRSFVNKQKIEKLLSEFKLVKKQNEQQINMMEKTNSTLAELVKKG